MIRRIKLFVSGFLLTSLLCLGATAPAFAQFDVFSDPCSKNPEATVCQDTSRSQSQSSNVIYGSGGIVSTVVSILSLVIGFAAIIVIIVAGIQYMLSTGDPTKVNNAKNTILYALVGLVIAVLARTIVVFVIDRI